MYFFNSSVFSNVSASVTFPCCKWASLAHSPRLRRCFSSLSDRLVNNKSVEVSCLSVDCNAKNYGPDPAEYQWRSVKLNNAVYQCAPITLASLLVPDRMHAYEARDNCAQARQKDVQNEADNVHGALKRVDLRSITADDLIVLLFRIVVAFRGWRVGPIIRETHNRLLKSKIKRH